MMKIPRSLITGGTAVAIAAVLAGCTVGNSAAPVPSATSAPTSATSSPSPVPSAVRAVAPGTVLATGAFVSADRRTTGNVTITAMPLNDGLAVRVSGFRSTRTGDPRLIHLSERAVKPNTVCFDNYGRIQDQISSAATQTFRYPGVPYYAVSNDPSFLDSVVLTVSAPNPADNCLWPVAEIAHLTWTMPDLHPGLAVVDSGTATGARGAVTITDGRPVSYVVAPGDTMASIAARFGITVADLAYLNPVHLALNPGMTMADDVYNLDRTSRAERNH